MFLGLLWLNSHILSLKKVLNSPGLFRALCSQDQLRKQPSGTKYGELLGDMYCALNIYLQGSGYVTDIFLSWLCRQDFLLPTSNITPDLGYTSSIYLNDHMLVNRVNMIYAHGLQISSDFSLSVKNAIEYILKEISEKYMDIPHKYVYIVGLYLNESRHRKCISINQ